MQTVQTKQQRAVMYARYSSDIQNEISIEDQLRLCRRLAEREKFKVVETYSDKAKSGMAAVESRAGLTRLMLDAQAKKFDVLIVEAYDRLVRDAADAIVLFQKLTFAGVTVLTVNEGKANELMVSLRAMINSMSSKDTAFRVRRHHSARAESGRVPGKVTYGYRAVPGKPGERVIDPAKAKIIKRIFEEYADERSPRDMAHDLTSEGVPTPNGAPAWSHQVFLGGTVRVGLLTNPIYKGVLVWNRTRNARDPFNQKRKTQQLAPVEDIVTTKVPHMRIVSDDLWDRVQAVREGRSLQKFGERGWVSRRPVISRGEWPLAGLLRCGVCNGSMRITQSGPRVGCATAHQHGTCDHRMTYDLARIQTLVVEGALKVLSDPDRHKGLMAKLQAESIAQQKTSRATSRTLEKELDTVQRQIKRLLSMAQHSDDDDTAIDIMKQVKPLERQRATLKERLGVTQGSNVVTVLPNALDHYNRTLASLAKDMGSADEVEVRRGLRGFMAWAVVHPTEKKAPYEVEVHARMGMLLGDEKPAQKRANSNHNTGNNGLSTLPVSYKAIALGRWLERVA